MVLICSPPDNRGSRAWYVTDTGVCQCSWAYKGNKYEFCLPSSHLVHHVVLLSCEFCNTEAGYYYVSGTGASFVCSCNSLVMPSLSPNLMIDGFV